MKIIRRQGEGLKATRALRAQGEEQVPRILPHNRYYGNASSGEGGGASSIPSPPVVWAAMSAARCEAQHTVPWSYNCHQDIPCCLMVPLYCVCSKMKASISGSSNVQMQSFGNKKIVQRMTPGHSPGCMATR